MVDFPDQRGAKKNNLRHIKFSDQNARISLLGPGVVEEAKLGLIVDPGT